ncbi:MAG: enoyl-CoA hydratase-related protein [Gemmataceae bacterium]
MTTASPVRLEFKESIAHIVLDQAGSRANVLSSATWSALSSAVAEIAARTDVDGLLITSAKDGIFLAGADLKELASLPMDDEAPARRVVRNGTQVLAAFESLPIPTAAAIDGAALGGGLEVALACDYRLAGNHPKLKLGLPEVKLGLIPGWGGTQRLPRIIGVERGAELLVTGRAVASADAVAMGLIDRVTDSATLVRESMEVLRAAPDDDWEFRRARKQSPYGQPIDLAGAQTIVEKMVGDEQIAGQAALRVLERGLPLPLIPAVACETDEFVLLLLSPASRARMAAFLQK